MAFRKTLPPSYRRALQARALGSAGQAVSMGSIGYGAGGPVFLDAFKSKRAPSPIELVNAYKAVAYSCVRLNVNGVARVPLRLYATTGPGERSPRCASRRLKTAEVRRLRDVGSKRPQARWMRRALGDAVEVDEILEHPFLEALDAPNPHFDGNLFLKYLAASIDVVGQAFIYPVRKDPTYAAREWWPLHAQYVFPVKGQKGQVLEHYQYFSETFAPDELVRIRESSVHDPYLSAFSPLHACFEQVGLSDYYTAVVESILKSGARPSVVFSAADAKTAPGEDERKRFERDINNRFTGGRSGHVLVTNGMWKVDPLTFPPADLAGLEISKNARLLIANCFDVPITLLEAESSNRASAEAGIFQHQYYAIEPRCVMIAAALTHQLARPVDPRLFFAFDDPVTRNNEAEAKVFQIYLTAGVMSPDEVRAELNYEAAPWGGEEPFMSKGLLKPTDAAAARERGMQAAEEAAKQPPPAAEASAVETEPDADDEADRALTAELTRTLARVGTRLDAIETTPPRGAGDGNPGNGAPHSDAGSAQGPEAGAPGGSGEHVWTADGTADRPRAETVDAGAAGEGQPGDPRDGDGAAGGAPTPDPGHGADGAGDDAAPDGILGRIGQESAGRPGAGPGGVESHEPVHEEQDSVSGTEVLRGDEPDDQPQSQ